MVQASSAGYKGGNTATISIDNEAIDLDDNENNHDRGLHIVTIDP